MAVADSYGLFWPSDNGDRGYDADSFEKWMKKFFTSGVMNGELQVVQNEGMTVRVNTGYCNTNGKIKFFETETDVILDPANPIYPRIDTIVIERNNPDRNVFIHKVTGAYSGMNPVATPPVRNNTVFQLVLAEVYVGAGVSEVTQANITDKRTDTNVCGWIVQAVQSISFEQFVAQFQAYFHDFEDENFTEFETWFDHMKGQLSEDAAGHLQQEVDTINGDADEYNAENTYEVEDVVIYNDILYRCVTAVEEPEAFDAEKWEKINLRTLDKPKFDSYDDQSVFDSGNLGGQSAYAWTNTNKIESEDPHPTLFRKISRMFKNIRTIAKIIGTTDISTIGGGTLSGAIKANNNAINANATTISSHTTAIAGKVDGTNLRNAKMSYTHTGDAAGTQYIDFTANCDNGWDYVLRKFLTQGIDVVYGKPRNQSYYNQLLTNNYANTENTANAALNRANQCHVSDLAITEVAHEYTTGGSGQYVSFNINTAPPAEGYVLWGVIAADTGNWPQHFVSYWTGGNTVGCTITSWFGASLTSRARFRLLWIKQF